MSVGSRCRWLVAGMLVMHGAEAAAGCHAMATESLASYGRAIRRVARLPELLAWARSHPFPVAYGEFADRQEPWRGRCFWSVSVYASRPERLALWQVFRVEVRGSGFLAMDPVSGEAISLRKWRAARRSRAEVPADGFRVLRSLVDSTRHGAAIAGAVLAGRTQGRVLASEDGQSALAYDNGFCVLLGGADLAFARVALRWLREDAGQPFFILYPGDAAWEGVLDTAAAAPIRKVRRVAFHLDRSVQREPAALPAGFRLLPMDAGVLGAVRGSLYPWAGGMWKSPELFEQEGVGFCVAKGAEIASLCYSVFVHGAHHEVDILTAPSFQRLGLARAAASAFVDACLRRGFEPGWDCFEANAASYRLALALGFVPVLEFPVYCWQRGQPAGG